MQTIEVSIGGQQTEDFDDDDILDEFIERVARRAAEPDSPNVFVVPLPELFGLSVDNAEKCVVVVVDNLSPRDIRVNCEFFCVDVQAKRRGKRITSLHLAEGRVILSGDVVPEIWHGDEDHRIVIVWLFKNQNARIGEYYYHDDIGRAFSPFRYFDNCNALVFDSFQTLGESGD